MNKREIIAEGLARGYSIAKSIDLVDIGDYGDGQYLNERNRVKITSDNWLEFHTNYAYECESNDRQFSPFEYLAHDINTTEDNPRIKFEPWQEFDEAIGRGINRALRERWKSISWTKKDYARGFDGSVDLFNACWRKLRNLAKSSVNLDWNNNKEVESWLETLASELVNEPTSRFYIYG
jgi:hypothetical protein